MSIILNVLKGILTKVISLAVMAALVFYAWGWYKSKREARTFTVSFNNVDGLNKGAPIFSNGLQVGKVISIVALGNTNDVGVKGLITDKDFPSVKSHISAKIIDNIESGGGKILEISAPIEHESGFLKEIVGDKKLFKTKGQSAQVLKSTMRLMRDFFQMSKDFGVAVFAALTSKQTQEYGQQVISEMENTITSLEYGTVKKDVEQSIIKLNQDIKHFEENPSNKVKAQKMLKNKAKALENTVRTYGALSEAYK